ncbi:hypothetical protein HY643_02025 [Candidatus Woesearchaeota archaeon]|nr:hypothetical protein [Candidatus Woesearchaeota archaeon]
MENNKNLEERRTESDVELKRLFQALSRSEEAPVVELGDVSKWEKIDPTTLIAAKKLGLELNKNYVPLLKNKEGLYTLIVGQYYKKKAEEQGLKNAALNIEALLQNQDTTLEQIELYAVQTFKDFPNQKEITSYVKKARKQAELNGTIKKDRFYTKPLNWASKIFNKKNEGKEETKEFSERSKKFAELGASIEESLKDFYKEIEGKKYNFDVRVNDIFTQEWDISMHSKKDSCTISIGSPWNFRGDNIHYIVIEKKPNSEITVTYKEPNFFGKTKKDILTLFEDYASSYDKKKKKIDSTITALIQIPEKLREKIMLTQQKIIEREEGLAKSIEDTIKRYKSIPPGRK